MPVDLRCDRCNKKIASVSYEKIREFVQTNGETCQKCLDMEEKLRTFYAGMRKSYDRKMDGLISKALEELASKIEELKKPDAERTD